MKQKRKNKAPVLHRSFVLEREHINEEMRTVNLAFSSETDQVERWDGIEILDHGTESIRLGRLQNSAPLLADHNHRDQIGVIESVVLGADRVARAVVRFGKSERASEIFNDVVDGIRTKVSVGYMIHKRMETEEGTNAKPVYRVTDWEPYEISIVSTPADDNVGIGRDVDLNEEETPETPPKITPKETRKMTPEEQAAKLQAEKVARDAETAQIRTNELSRQNDIRTIAKKYKMDDEAETFLNDGSPVDKFRSHVLDNLKDPSDTPAPTRHANVEMENGEHEQYSVVRAIRAASSGDWADAGLEKEVSDSIGKQLGRDTSGIFIPTNLRSNAVLAQRMGEIAQRAGLDTATGAAGGFGVQTNVMSLIDMLRNRMMVRKMGARVLTGLTGDLSFPRQASGSAFSWVAENPGSNVAQSDATFEQVAMSPKAGQSTTAFSKQFLAQSSFDVEAFIRQDLIQAAALGLDLAAINGSGSSNQPEGILNVTGIGSVAGGTNGAAATFANMVDLETAVAAANADVANLGYLTNAKVRGALKKKAIETGDAAKVWTKGEEMEFGEVNGYRAGVTNQVPSNLVKGTSGAVCSAAIYGNWDDLIIGEWGAMEILVDPYALKKQGMIEVTSFVMADIAVRHPESFAAMVDILA